MSYFERQDRAELRRDLLAETRLRALALAVEHDRMNRERVSDRMLTPAQPFPGHFVRVPEALLDWEI